MKKIPLQSFVDKLHKQIISDANVQIASSTKNTCEYSYEEDVISTLQRKFEALFGDSEDEA